MFWNKKKKDVVENQESESLLDSGQEQEIDHEEVYIDEKLRELIAPDGCDPQKNSYLVLNDNGQELFVRTFFVSQLPNNADFAVSFAHLLNVPESISSVFVSPLTTSKASKSLDKDVISIEAENITARKQQDSNRVRKLLTKLNNANEWAYKVESNRAKMSEVCFLVTIYAGGVNELDKKTADLFFAADKNSIVLTNSYGYQYEAFLANQPLNNIVQYVHKEGISGLPRGFAWHRMDQNAIATIFNHTTSEIFHENGIYIGYNLDDMSPVIHDLYDKTHKGYGLIVTGTTGGGKSLTIKLLMSRYLQDEFRFVCLDSDSSGRRGEFSAITEMFNGVNYYIAPDSNEILNIFEIDEEDAYDETTGNEWRTLALNEKIIDSKHILLAIVNRYDQRELFGLHAYTIETLIVDTIQDLYRSVGLVEGDAESLYESSSNMKDGMLGTGKSKKRLPIFSDFFTKIIYYRSKETEERKLPAYDILIDAIKPYVRHKIICHNCCTEYTSDEFNELKKIDNSDNGVRYRVCTCGGEVELIEGTQPYYDGESTVNIAYDTRIVNIDISQLHENEKPVAQAIALSYIKERFIKKNAANPNNVSKLGVIFDEVHKTFTNEYARKLVSDVYRIARKRFVAPITGTQSIADFTMYEDTMAIIKNATTQVVLSHKVKDMEALEALTELTSVQIKRAVTFDTGECYVIDNGKPIHTKIDYFVDVEAPYLETDVSQLKKMRENTLKEGEAIA